MTPAVLRLLGCLAVFNVAHASAAAPNQWYRQTSVKYIYAGPAGSRVAVAVTTPLNVGDCDGQEMNLDPANPHFKTILMLVTASYLSGKPLSVYTQGTCAWGGVVLTDVYIGGAP
jgi:hypothetical protein